MAHRAPARTTLSEEPTACKTMIQDAIAQNKLFTETRIPSLYSDFKKLEQINPDGYEANLIAWKSLIQQLFHGGHLSNCFVLDTTGLLDELTLAHHGKPMCVDLVLETMVKAGDLIPWSVWTSSHDGIYAKHWVKPVVSWAINRFVWDTSYKLSDKKGLKADKLVNKSMLEGYTKELFKLISNKRHELLFEKDQLRHFLNEHPVAVEGVKRELSDLDYEVLLTYLKRDLHKVQIRDGIVKFGEDEITPEDIGICEIKTTIKRLEDRNNELQSKIDSTSVKLKQSLANKSNKQLSLNLLRSKKIAEQSLSKQLASLTQLESVMYKIDESSSNLQLLNALEKGSAVLKSLNTQLGGVERVEAIMDEIEDQKYAADKITEEITRLDEQVNDEEVEEELAKMLAEETSKDKETEEIAKKLEGLEIAPSKQPEKNVNEKIEQENQPLHN